MCLGLTNGSQNFGMGCYNYYGYAGGLGQRSSEYKNTVGSGNWGNGTAGIDGNGKNIGVTRDPSGSGIVCAQDADIKMCIKY